MLSVAAVRISALHSLRLNQSDIDNSPKSYYNNRVRFCNGGMKNRYRKISACAIQRHFQPLHKFISSAGGKVRHFGCDPRRSLRDKRAWPPLHPKGALRPVVFKQANGKFLRKAAFRQGLYRSEAFTEQLTRKADSAHPCRKRALRQNRRSGLRCGMCGVRRRTRGLERQRAGGQGRARGDSP